jgi:hypothetical protein
MDVLTQRCIASFLGGVIGAVAMEAWNRYRDRPRPAPSAAPAPQHPYRTAAEDPEAAPSTDWNCTNCGQVHRWYPPGCSEFPARTDPVDAAPIVPSVHSAAALNELVKHARRAVTTRDEVLAAADEDRIPVGCICSDCAPWDHTG